MKGTILLFTILICSVIGIIVAIFMVYSLDRDFSACKRSLDYVEREAAKDRNECDQAFGAGLGDYREVEARLGVCLNKAK